MLFKVRCNLFKLNDFHSILSRIPHPNIRSIPHPTSPIPNISHSKYPTSRTSHMTAISHPQHLTSQTSHIPNIPNITHRKHTTFQTCHILNIQHHKHPTFRKIPHPKYPISKTSHIPNRKIIVSLFFSFDYPTEIEILLFMSSNFVI